MFYLHGGRSLDNGITLIQGDCDACGTLVVTKNVHRGVRRESIFPAFTQPTDFNLRVCFANPAKYSEVFVVDY